MPELMSKCALEVVGVGRELLRMGQVVAPREVGSIHLHVGVQDLAGGLELEDRSEGQGTRVIARAILG